METFVGDTIKIILNTYIDCSSYETLVIKFKKPSGITGTWPATMETDNTKISYVTEPSDLDEKGEWAIQAHVEAAGAQLHGKWAAFTVFEPIADPETV